MVFNPRESSEPDDPLKLPCGQCIGCRLDRSRIWAIRCVHEASLYQRNCFITLTYNKEHLPPSGSLNKRDFQLFMKRLRKRFGAGVRYFMCGEYGDKNKRPHYHACLFNFDFHDREHWSTRSGFPLYISEELQKLWSDPKTGKPLGFCTIGEVNFETAAYVARYVTKKVTGSLAPFKYGEVREWVANTKLAPDHPKYWRPYKYAILQEYTCMSRRPGVGAGWFNKFASDVFPHDRVILNGKQLRPPKYYDRIFDVANPEVMEDVKSRRIQNSKQNAKDSTYERLRSREQLQQIRAKQLIRGYEK